MVSTISRSHFDLEPLQRALAVMACMLLFFYECKVYDLSSAMFFAFGLGLLVRRAWLRYLLVFALGCLNRETIVLLTLVFAVHYWDRLDRKTWLTLLTLQLIIFVSLRLWLLTIFALSPGVPYWWRLTANLLIFQKDVKFMLWHLLGFGLVLSPCILRWQLQPIFIRQAFSLLLPALTVLYLIFGWVGELRVFIEAFPVIWYMTVGTAT